MPLTQTGQSHVLIERLHPAGRAAQNRAERVVCILTGSVREEGSLLPTTSPSPLSPFLEKGLPEHARCKISPRVVLLSTIRLRGQRFAWHWGGEVCSRVLPREKVVMVLWPRVASLG